MTERLTDEEILTIAAQEGFMCRLDDLPAETARMVRYTRRIEAMVMERVIKQVTSDPRLGKSPVAATVEGEIERLRLAGASNSLASLAQRLAKENSELERERVRLAGCGVAALGYVKEPVPEYGDSASLQDVLRLRRRCEVAEKERDEHRGTAIALERRVIDVQRECDEARRLHDEHCMENGLGNECTPPWRPR